MSAAMRQDPAHDACHGAFAGVSYMWACILERHSARSHGEADIQQARAQD